MEIQKLFDGHGGVNKPPIAKIRIDGKLVRYGDATFYRSHLDTIFLDGSSSIDDESPKKYLKYTWKVNKKSDRIASNKRITNAYISDFKFENSQQKLVINEPGKYTFSLEVSDGVAKSVIDSVNILISVINKPFLELHQASWEKITQSNLYNYFFSKKEKFIKNAYSIGFNVTEFDTLSKLVFKYLYSYDRSKKFFLEGKPGFPKGSVVLSHGPNKANNNKKETSTLEMMGLKIDTSRFENPGLVNFWLTNKIIPGKHKYLMYTNSKGVTSNFDTLTISHREKSLFSIYAGYETFWGYKGIDYLNGFTFDVLQFGFRVYITQRLFADLNFLFPKHIQDNSNEGNRDIGINSLAGKINYDIPTGQLSPQSGRIPLYFSGFLAVYKLHVSDNNEPVEGFWQLGIGPKIRAQLFSNNSKIGTWYLEAEYCYYQNLAKNSYTTQSIGFNLIYGIWNY